MMQMKSLTLVGPALLFLAIFFNSTSVFPSRGATLKENWMTAAPTSEGFVSNKLQTLWNDLEQRHTTAFVIIRNDRIVFERYAPGYSRTKPHGTASMAKALVGGTSLMVAMNDGAIRPDDLASLYVPQWAADPLKR